MSVDVSCNMFVADFTMLKDSMLVNYGLKTEEIR